ncbi:MAG: hypothetical protein DWB56_05850 [Candidatus Jettenia sp.]|nr:MAG: hypothetical protein EDM77_00780 [Candidatus Jettenia sp. AMX1]MBC6928475.1 hypothetical protein [Candidatus Jettenia sp.]MCE7879849.1 hypothetical protein [Candidatus Jettenia sp. AMX1]MCQ3925871.1 hypothetical protein [Candidatus Jettenia sp.]
MREKEYPTKKLKNEYQNGLQKNSLQGRLLILKAYAPILVKIQNIMLHYLQRKKTINRKKK